MPNEPTKEGPLTYVRYSKSPHLPQFEQVTCRGHPSLVFVGEIRIRRQQRKRNYKLCQMNQPRKDPFHMYSKSPHLPQFQEVSKGHPFLVSPSFTYSECGVVPGRVGLQEHPPGNGLPNAENVRGRKN